MLNISIGIFLSKKLVNSMF